MGSKERIELVKDLDSVHTNSFLYRMDGENTVVNMNRRKKS